MGSGIMNDVKSLWRFRNDYDLRVSDELVKELGIMDESKRFVFAIKEQDTQAVVYVVCVQNLSKRYAVDVERVVSCVRPSAVVARVNEVDFDNVGGEEGCLIPTSLGVVKRCFLHKIGKDKYENVAGSLVLKEIFGVGFNGHFWVTERMVEEVGSLFMLLQSSSVKLESENHENNHLRDYSAINVMIAQGGFVTFSSLEAAGSALNVCLICRDIPTPKSEAFRCSVQIITEHGVDATGRYTRYVDVQLKSVGRSSCFTGCQWIPKFTILKEESIDSSFARFNTIIISLKALDEGFSSKNYIRKFLRVLHPKWRSKIFRQPQEEKKSFRKRDDKKGKSDRKCFRCCDPNHLISECPKSSRNKDQKAFVRGSQSDIKNEVEDKTNDETCLMAQSLNEVTFDSFHFSDNASSFDKKLSMITYVKLA
ncbi:zf-CCHC domain-containing protein [Tanacetum coccineum]